MQEEIINLTHKYSEKIICTIEVNKEEMDNLIENLNEFNFKIEDYKIISQKNIRKNIDK